MTLDEILYKIPYKFLNSLHEARRERLSAERERMDKEEKLNRSNDIRNQIMKQ